MKIENKDIEVLAVNFSVATKQEDPSLLDINDHLKSEHTVMN